MRRAARTLRLGAALALWAGVAGAVEPQEMLADPGLEARARALSRELRCVVCQNQSIDDSNAPIARDLRRLVRERLAAGDADADVLAHLRARYGDYVLLTPPLNPATLALWATPAAVLALGAVAAWALWRRRPAPGAAPDRPLDPAEAARLAVLAPDAAQTAGVREIRAPDSNPS